MNASLESVCEILALQGRMIYSWEIGQYLSPGRSSPNRVELNRFLSSWLEAGMGRQCGQQLEWDCARLHQIMVSLPVERIRAAYAKAPTHFHHDGGENALRLAAYANDEEQVSKLHSRVFCHFLWPVFPLPWYLSRKPLIQLHIMRDMAGLLYRYGLMAPEIQRTIESFRHPLAQELQIELALFQGNWDRWEQLLSQNPAHKKAGYEAAGLFLQGKVEESHAAFLKAMGKRKSQTPAFAGMAGLLGRLAAMHCNDVAAMQNARYDSPAYPLESELLVAVAEKLHS